MVDVRLYSPRQTGDYMAILALLILLSIGGYAVYRMATDEKEELL